MFRERLFVSELRKVNLCAAAVPIITCASACFVLSGSPTPAAPASRMPACGERVGGKFTNRGIAIGPKADARAKGEVGIEV